MTVLITGACGMVGSHMIEQFSKEGKRVIGTYYKPTTNLDDIYKKAELIECDVRYFHNVLELILKYKPDVIFHLAAQSYPSVSWKRPQETMDINVNGTINVFESIKHVRLSITGYDPIVIVACSSAEYGASLTPNNVPIKENTLLLPLHPYGVSKVAQDLLAYQYFISDSIKAIRARIFNTTGPKKVNDVASDFTRRAVEIEKGYIPPILRVGNINTSRAITDVRDLVMALRMLAEKGTPGEVYNISGSKAYPIEQLITIIREYINVPFSIQVDESLIRPTDEPIIFGDSSKLIQDTGWEQTYTIEDTIHDMIDFWREIL
jgi:nucleoside-diphosphate-sugar epimerase